MSGEIKFWDDMKPIRALKKAFKLMVGNTDNGDAEQIEVGEILDVFTTDDLKDGETTKQFKNEYRDKIDNSIQKNDDGEVIIPKLTTTDLPNAAVDVTFNRLPILNSDGKFAYRLISEFIASDSDKLGGFDADNFYGKNNITKKVITDLLDNFQSLGLDSKDNRAIKPSQVNNYFQDGLQFYFSSLGGLTSPNSDTNYIDLLVLDSYYDDTGGKINALAFDKRTSNKITHFQGNNSDTVWSKIGMLYTEATLTYDILISLLKDGGNDIKLPLNDAGIDINYDRLSVFKSNGEMAYKLLSEFVASNSKKLGGVDADNFLDFKGRSSNYTNTKSLVGKQGIYGIVGIPIGVSAEGNSTYGVLLNFNNENVDCQVYLTKDGRIFLKGFLNGNELTTNFVEIYGKNNLTKKVITDLLGNFQSLGIGAIDKRALKPNQADDYFQDGLQFYFSSLGGLTSPNSDTNYIDLLVLNSYYDDTGGKINALAFDKKSNKITHFQGNNSDTVWTKIGMLYTEATLTYAVLIGLLKNSGTDVTLPLNDAGIDVTYDRIVVRNSAGKLKHIDRDKFVTEDDMGNLEYIDYLNSKITNTLII